MFAAKRGLFRWGCPSYGKILYYLAGIIKEVHMGHKIAEAIIENGQLQYIEKALPAGRLKVHIIYDAVEETLPEPEMARIVREASGLYTNILIYHTSGSQVTIGFIEDLISQNALNISILTKIEFLGWDKHVSGVF